MNVIKTPIDGLYVIENTPLIDHRGSFTRQFCIHELEPLLAGRAIQQINHSYTKKRGTIRGIHLQTGNHAETKIVRCISGKIFDVAVDLRKGSATFLQHYSIELSASNPVMFLIPEGVGHGFQSISDNVEIQYLVTESYSAPSEVGFKYDDPALAIDWPMTREDISEKDLNHSYISSSFSGFEVCK